MSFHDRVHARATLVALLVALSACGSAPQPAKIDARPFPIFSSPKVPASALTLEGVPEALVRAYASQDEASLRDIARVLEAKGSSSDAASEPAPVSGLSYDEQRFAVVTARGLFWGSAESFHIEGFFPGVKTGDIIFLPDPKWLVIRTRAPVHGDAVQLEWPLDQQQRFSLIDLAHRRIALARPGRVVASSPNRKTLLVSDGNDTKLGLLDLDTLAERPVSFDVATAVPPAWQPTACEEQKCTAGPPRPWNLSESDVTFSEDGLVLALNWNGFSRGYDQGVTVHALKTGAMVGSFSSNLVRAVTTFSAKGSTLAILLSSKNAPPPYHASDTAILFNAEKRQARTLTGCVFDKKQGMSLALSHDDAHAAVWWATLSGSETCVFDVVGNGVAKIADLDHRDYAPKPTPRPRYPYERQSVAARERMTCLRSGYLLPRNVCGPEPEQAPEESPGQ